MLPRRAQTLRPALPHRPALPRAHRRGDRSAAGRRAWWRSAPGTGRSPAPLARRVSITCTWSRSTATSPPGCARPSRRTRSTVHEGDALDFDFAQRCRRRCAWSATCPTTSRRRSSFAWPRSPSALPTASSCCRRKWSSAWWRRPAAPSYGRLSVMLQYRFEMDELRSRCPPGAFTPPPKVDSAVVRMVPLGPDRLRARDEALFARIVGAAFSQRRKTLRQRPQAAGAARCSRRRRNRSAAPRRDALGS